MRTLTILLVVLIVAAATVGEAQAQRTPVKVNPRVRTLHSVDSLYNPGTTYGGYPTPYPAVSPYPLPYHYRHASTAAEGYLRGLSALTTARAAANVMNAQSRVIDEEAQRRDIENRENWADTYHRMRETNKAAREAARGPRLTQEDANRIAQAGRPEELSPSQLNVDSGKVTWPALLQADEFAGFRADMEDAFAQRAVKGGIGAAEQAKVKQAANGLLSELKKHVRDVSPMDYTTARQFIKSLAYEAGQPAS